MSQFKVELNDMELLIDTYSRIAEKMTTASEHIKKAQEQGVSLLVAGAAKDTVYSDSGVYLFSKVFDDFSANARVLSDYTAKSLKEFVDMDKIIAKQTYENLQNDKNADPEWKKYINDNPDEASKDMYMMVKDPKKFKQQQEAKQKEYKEKQEAAQQAAYAQQTQQAAYAQQTQQAAYAQQTQQAAYAQQTQQAAYAQQTQQAAYTQQTQQAAYAQQTQQTAYTQQTQQASHAQPHSFTSESQGMTTEFASDTPLQSFTQPTQEQPKSFSAQTTQMDVEEHQTTQAPPSSFGSDKNEPFGSRYKDADTVLKETIRSNEPVKTEWKTEQVTDFRSGISKEKTTELTPKPITNTTNIGEAMTSILGSLNHEEEGERSW